MKNIDDVLAQFAQVPDPAVDPETLGAYIEGNLSPEESLEVEAVLNDSPAMSYLMSAATDPEPEILDDLSLDELPDLPDVPGLAAADVAVEVLDEPEVAEVDLDDPADAPDSAAADPATDPTDSDDTPSFTPIDIDDQPIDPTADLSAADFIDFA